MYRKKQKLSTALAAALCLSIAVPGGSAQAKSLEQQRQNAQQQIKDIKADIKYYGEYTFSKEDVERGWYSLLISGTDENGTNVTRLIFHTHLENSEWEIETTTFPVQADTAKTKATKQISLTAKGLKQHLSVKPSVDINRISPRSFKRTENSK